MKLLDTSVIVDHLRGTEEAVALLTGVTGSGGRFLASEVTRFELLAGVRNGEEPALEMFFRVVERAPVDEQVSRLAGDPARKFRRSHRRIDVADCLVAATALLLDADLLTRNVRHFPMFPDLHSRTDPCREGLRTWPFGCRPFRGGRVPGRVGA